MIDRYLHVAQGSSQEDAAFDLGFELSTLALTVTNDATNLELIPREAILSQQQAGSYFLCIHRRLANVVDLDDDFAPRSNDEIRVFRGHIRARGWNEADVANFLQDNFGASTPRELGMGAYVKVLKALHRRPRIVGC